MQIAPKQRRYQPNVQVFKTSGIWRKPPGAQFVRVIAYGGGGGGGGGGVGSSFFGGGGGGAAGGAFDGTFKASDLTPTVVVTVGAGGAGGAGGSAGAGSASGSGGATSFGSYASAGNGNFATGGGNGPARAERQARRVRGKYPAFPVARQTTPARPPTARAARDHQQPAAGQAAE